MSTEQKFKDLNARIDAIDTGIKEPITVDALIRQIEPPIHVESDKGQSVFQIQAPSPIEDLWGKLNPMDHLDSFKNLMLLQGALDEVMCRAFSTTLREMARSWFRKLSPKTIDSFYDLSKHFLPISWAAWSGRKTSLTYWSSIRTLGKSLKSTSSNSIRLSLK